MAPTQQQGSVPRKTGRDRRKKNKYDKREAKQQQRRLQQQRLAVEEMNSKLDASINVDAFTEKEL